MYYNKYDVTSISMLRSDSRNPSQMVSLISSSRLIRCLLRCCWGPLELDLHVGGPKRSEEVVDGFGVTLRGEVDLHRAAGMSQAEEENA